MHRLLQTAKDLRNYARFRRVPNAVRGVFSSFSEAACSAPPDRKLGYDTPEHAEMYDDRIGKLAIRDYPVLFWLSKLLGEVSSVFDFGGHIGLTYYGCAQRVSFPPGFRWLVCDYPATVERGRSLAGRFSAAPLQFTTTWDNGDGCDLLLASGVLQYVEDSLSEKLGRWTRLPGHILVNATPMYEGPPYITLQNTHLSYNPYRVFNRADLVGSIEALGYQLMDHWRTDRSLRVPLHPDRTVEAYQGLYFRRADRTP